MFCYLFSFKVPFVYNSAVVACAMVLGHAALRPNILVDVRRALFNRMSLWLNAIVVIFFSYSALCTILHGEYDFSFIVLLASYCFYALFAPIVVRTVQLVCKIEATEAVINAFIAQSFIIVAAFFIPALRDAMRIFKDEAQLEIADSYYGGGLRGLALAGGLFFSLSCGYCLYFILIARRFSQRKFGAIGICCVLASMFSAVTAGRTSLLGIALSAGTLFLYYALPHHKVVLATNLRRLVLVIVGIVICVLIIVPWDTLTAAFDGYARFSFEMVFNFFEGRGLTTSSTDRLSEMYFPLRASEILGGDGRYSTASGGYYRQTDAGYMRNVLLGGLPAVILAVTHLAVWFLAMKRYMSVNVSWREDRIFLFTVVLMVLLLHYKGEALVYVVMVNNLLYVAFFERLYRATSKCAPDGSAPGEAVLGY
jgi:hypothetical protein